MKRYLQTIVIGSLSLAAISCGNKDQSQGAKGPMPYEVIQVPTQNVTGYTAYPTTLQGKVNSNVRAKISGYIVKVLVDEGATVKKGQPLFQLETNILTQNADAAKAGIRTAEAQVLAAQVNVDKLVPLVAKGIVSNVQLETAKANLASAQGQLSSAKSQYNSIAANIDFSIIKSPIDGIVGAIPFREGTLVSPNDATPLTVVSEDSEVFAYFSMNEKEYFSFLEKIEGNTLKEKLNHLPEVELKLVNGTTYQHKGKIETFSGQINTATGTVQIRAAFPNKEKFLSNGNSGTILLPKIYNDVLVVPESSTFEQQGEFYVYKVENDTAKSVKIEILDRINKLALVKSGLEKNATIIGQGIGTLRSGTPIAPKPVKFESINDSYKPTF